jgi:hypothetical protein
MLVGSDSSEAATYMHARMNDDRPGVEHTQYCDVRDWHCMELWLGT